MLGVSRGLSSGIGERERIINLKSTLHWLIDQHRSITA